MNITYIDKTNIDAFEGLMPESDFENIKKDSNYYALGMVDDEQGYIAIAAICGTLNADSFNITSLFVVNEYRRQGIAETLLYALTAKCADAEIYFIYCDFPFNEMPELHAFFTEMGFDEEPLVECRAAITIGQAKQLNHLQFNKVSAAHDKVMSFSSISPQIIKAFSGKMYKAGNVYLGDYLAEKAVDPELSLVYMNGDVIESMVVANRLEDEIVIHWAYADSRHPALLLITLREFFRRIAEQFDDDTLVTTATVTDISVKLMQAITGGQAEIVEKWVRMSEFV